MEEQVIDKNLQLDKKKNFLEVVAELTKHYPSGVENKVLNDIYKDIEKGTTKL